LFSDALIVMIPAQTAFCRIEERVSIECAVKWRYILRELNIDYIETK